MKKSVGIVGLGMYLPEKVMTNLDLSKMVDTSDEWITTRTGIKERRIADPSQSTSDLAAEAAKEAIKDAKMDASEIELLIICTISPDRLMPATACIVQNKIGAKNAACFDLSAACAGFIFGITCAKSMIQSGLYKNALVIGADVLSKFVDWKDRSTCVLFGDGAGAVVLKESKACEIVSTYLGNDGLVWDLLQIPAGGSSLPASHETVDQGLHYIKMQGNELFKVAVTRMIEAAKKVLADNNMTSGDVDLLIPHQANQRIIDATTKRLNIPDEKVFINLTKYGNMSSAASVVALVEAVKEKKVKTGDNIVMVAFGGGLAWGSALIKW